MDTADIAPSQSQVPLDDGSQVPLFEDTQSQSPLQTTITCEGTHSDKQLKRKVPLCDSDDEDYDYGLTNVNKRSKTAFYDLIKTIKNDRSQMEKERAEMRVILKNVNENIELERDLRMRTREAYEQKFDEIDTAFKRIVCKIDNVKVTNDQIQLEARSQHAEVGSCLERMESLLQENRSNNSFTPLFREPNASIPPVPKPSPPKPSPSNSSPPNLSPSNPSLPNPSPPNPSPPNPSPATTAAGQRPNASTSDQSSPRTSSMTSGPNQNASHHNSTGDNRKPKLLLITDSNGKYLNPKRLKSEIHGVKYDRYTTKEAMDKIPKVSDPNEVTDIVFQVGYNDLRGGSTPEEVQESVLEVQLAYNKHFPNARQHITAVPPVDDNHVNLCKQLQKLSSFTECNFVSTNVFKDKTSGKLRSGMTNITQSGVHHYSEWGLKILAKEIKKSLYSTANTGNARLPRMREIRQNKTKQTPVPQNNE